jgi:phage protein D
MSLFPDVFAPTFAITVNAVPLPPETALQVMDVQVTLHRSPPDSFSFRLNDPAQVLVDLDRGVFTEGSRVEISLGFVGSTKTLLVGEITDLDADVPSDGPATLEVAGFDLLHRLTRGTCYRTFEGATPGSGLPDSEIVAQIAAEMELSSSVDATPERTEPRTQRHVSNLAFLEELAGASGFLYWVEGDTLCFKRERPAPATVTLERGKTLVSFAARLSTVDQVETVSVRRWDPIQKQTLAGTASRADTARLAATGQEQLARGAGGRSELVLTEAPVASAEEAQAHAEAVVAAQEQTLVTGRGTCVGNPDLVAGTLVEVVGVGRFDGTYVVERASHRLGAGGYQTTFQVRSQP